MSAPASDYLLFGLRVRSEFELPELAPLPGEGQADVCVSLGSINLPDEGPGLSTHDGALLLAIGGVGRFLVSRGEDIVVEPVAGVNPRNVRLFLLGSAFGALLHQRGLLPLHANAVEIGGRAVAFMGESGAGKSTLAAWFHDQGYRVIADDVCVVGFEGSGPRVAPGPPRLRLWKDALESSGRDLGQFARSFEGDAAYDKFDVPIAGPAQTGGPIPLSALYLLSRSDALRIEPVEGVAAVDGIFANTYRGAFVDHADTAQRHWQASVRLATSIPVFRLGRQWSLTRLDHDGAKLIEHITRSSPPPSG